MRANAIEKVLVNLIDAIQTDDQQAVKNYCVKADILLDRNANSAAVIKELMNARN